MQDEGSLQLGSSIASHLPGMLLLDLYADELTFYSVDLHAAHVHSLLSAVKLVLVVELPPECCNWVQVGLTEVQVTPVLQHMRQACALYAHGVLPMHIVVPTLPPEQWPPWSQELVRWGVPLVCKGQLGGSASFFMGRSSPRAASPLSHALMHEGQAGGPVG